MAPLSFARRLKALFSNTPIRKSTRTHAGRRQPPRVELLEDRLTPANVRWTGGAGTLSWTTGGNWSTGSVPGSGDNVTISIPVSGAITITTGTQAINSLNDTSAALTVTGGSLSLAVSSSISQNLTVTQSGAVSASSSLTVGSLTLAGNTPSVNALSGAGTVTVEGALVWTGGIMQGPGETVVEGSAQLGNPAGSAANTYLSIAGRSLVLESTGTVNGEFEESSSANVTVQPGGSLDLLVGPILTDGNDNTISFVNEGTVDVNAGTGTFDFQNVPVTNSGIVQVNTGTLVLFGGGNQSGSFTAASGATLNFGGGTFTMTAGASVGGAGSVNFSSTFYSPTITFNSGSTYDVTTSTSVNCTVTFNTVIESFGQSLTVAYGSLTLSDSQQLTVGSLTLDIGATFTNDDSLTDTGALTWTGGTLTGTGTTTIDGAAQIGEPVGSASGDNQTLEGCTLILSGTATLNDDANGGLGLQSSATLEVLSGASLDLVQGSVEGDGTATTFSNAGSINVTAGTGTLYVNDSLTNTGIVKVNSGTLAMQDGGSTSGSFTVSSGATLQFYSGTFTVGFGASVAGTGTVDFGGTFDSPTVTFQSGSTYYVTGGMDVANGTTTFNSPVTTLGQTLTISGGTLTVSGGLPTGAGAFVFSGGTLTGTDTISISGALTWTGGTMSGTGATILDGAAQLGEPPGDTGFDDEILTTRTLEFAGTGTINNPTFGQLEMHSSAAVVVTSSGTLDLVRGQISSDGSANTITNDGTVDVTAGASNTFLLQGPMTNAGSVVVESGTFDVNGGGSQPGSFTAQSGATLDFETGTYAFPTGSLVGGAGSVIFGATFDDPTVTFSSGSTYNPVTATTVGGGSVTFNTPVTSLGQSLTISGGTLTLSGGQPVTVGTYTMSGGTLTGSDTLTVSGGMTWTGGIMTGTGKTVVDGTSQFGGAIGSPGEGYQTIVGRTFELGGFASLNDASISYISLQSSASFQVLAGGTLDMLTGDVFSDASATSFTNAGTVSANVGSGVTVSIEGTFTNTGTVTVVSGVLQLSGTLTNFASNTLTAGSYVVEAGLLEFKNANVVTNAASITLDGPSAGIDNLSGGSGLANFATNTAGGSFTVLGGDSFSAASSFTNQGSVTIDSTAASTSFTVTTYTQSGTGATTTLVDGGTLIGNTSVNIGAGTTLAGTGTVESAVTNSGTLSPGTGTTPGKITIQGTYTQTSTGVFNVKLKSAGTAGVGYDALSVSGTVALGGTIDVTEVVGFVPAVNNSFQVITCGATTSPGDFSTKTGYALGNGLVLSEKFNTPPSTTSLDLVVEQEHVQFVNQPTNTVAGKAIDGTTGGLQVELLDDSGNVISYDNTDQITLSAGTNTLTGGTATVVNGVATFPDVAITAAALSYQLTASTGSNSANATSNTFNITPDVASQLVFTTQPTGGRVGDTLGSVVVTEEDQYHNVESGDSSSSISLALSPNSGALSGTIPQTVAGGVATFSNLSINEAGTGYELTASTGGLSKASTSFNISALDTTTSAASGSGNAGQSVTLQATVSAVSSSFPVNEGTVTFEVFNGSTELGSPVVSGTVTNGQVSASFPIPTLTAHGNYTVEAFYSDSSGTDFNASQSNPGSNGTLAISSIYSSTTTTAANASATFSSASQPVTLGASVTSADGTINVGTVTFAVFQGSTQIGSSVTSGTVSNGTAGVTYTLPAGTAVGAYTVDATYNMGGDFLTSSDNTRQLTVGTATTTTAASDATATFGESSQTVTLGANVSSSGTVGAGTVTFSVFSGSTQIGTSVTSGTVSGGSASASYTLPAGTPAGTYTIDATYNPGSGFSGSSDNTHHLTVSAASTTTTASAVSTPFSSTSQVVTLSASVQSGAGAVNVGTVTFGVFSGSTQIGTSVTSGTVSGGSASASYTLPAGTVIGNLTIDATYNPGTNFATSSDNTHQLTVSPAATATAAANASATFNSGTQSLTLSAAVTSTAGTVSGGTVTFAVFQGSTQIGSSVTSGSVNNGSASVSYTLPAGTAPGSYTIDATYNAGGNFATSSDNAHRLSVSTASTITTAANATSSFSETSQSVTISATVTSGAGTVNAGTVTFSVFAGNSQVGSSVTSGTVSGGSASASFTLPAASALGTYTIDATYNAGSGFATSSDDTHHLTVTPAVTVTAAGNASATFSNAGQTVSLSATVTSGAGTVNVGTVTFAVFAGTTQLGSSVTSGTVSGGSASVSYTLPAGAAAGTYTIYASYNPGSGFSGSSDNTHQLTIASAASSTAASNSSVIFSATTQMVTLTAAVTSPAGAVNGGTVSFAVFGGATQIGSPVTSGTVSAGSASASYALPAGTALGTYTIHATYNSGGNFAGSSDNAHQLTVGANPNSPPYLPPLGSTNTVSLPSNQFPYSTTIQGVTPDGSTLTYGVTAVGDSQAYDLQRLYQFTGVGNINSGAPAYVLHSNQPGPGAGGYYLIRPSDGALFAYDGSGSYAHTFANSTPIATLGANFYYDPNLLFNALPPADYVTLQSLESTYQFTGLGVVTAGATAYVLHGNASGPGIGGYYLIRPSDGALFAYDGSGNYAHTFANSTPIATLGQSVYNSPSELLNAQASPSLYAQLYQVNQEFDLQELNGSFYTNTYGNEAQWIYSPVLNQYGQHWYTLVQSGGQSVLHAWEGYQDSATGAVVATFNTTSVYSNPTLLTNATYLPDPAAGTATIDGSGNLSVSLPGAGYVGSFKVVINASDGSMSSSETVTFDSTGSAPTLTVSSGNTTIAPGGTQTVSAASFPVSDTLMATDPGGTVNVSASAASFSLPFSLEQQYQFKGIGYVNAGSTAYILQAANNSIYGNPYYLLNPNGSLYAYDGSGSFTHTFADVTPLAMLGTIFYTDPTLLTNAQPAVAYATLYNLQQQYQFTGLGTVTAGATAYVLHSNQAGAGVGGYYLLSPAGGLYAYDGSGSFAHTFANSTPIASLDPGVYTNPSILLNAKAAPALYSQLYEAEQQFDLEEMGGSFYTGQDGNAAKWLYSPIPNAKGQNWYTLVLGANGTQADLYAWDGGSNSIPAGSQPVAVLDSSVYANPTLLLNAKATPAATGVTATVNNGTLTLSPPAGFVGSFQVTVTATFGDQTTTETFQVVSSETAPVPTAIIAQSASQSGAPLQLNLGSTGGSGTVTYSASAVGYSAAYNLQQEYNFTGLGYYSAGGATAYLLQSSVLGGTGGFYLLSSTGGVYAYDGSGSYAHTFANSANLIAQLPAGTYNTPTQLTNAQAPTAPAAVVSVNGNSLTVNVAGVPVGTVFEVIVTATDGVATERTGFLVTVTA